MKTIFLFLLIVMALFVVLWLMPVESRKAVILKNRIEHVDRMISVASNWKKWYGPAHRNDAASCIVTPVGTGNGFQLRIRNKQIKVQPQPGLQYSVDISSTNNTALVIALSPGELANETKLIYAYRGRLFGKIFPFLQNQMKQTCLFAISKRL